MGNTRNTGYLQNIVQYDASNNITLPARLAVTGTVSINNTTPYDTTQFSLDVNGGLIVKNINKTAQFVLINSNPATGGNNAFVVHTVGGTSATSYADIQGYYGTSISGNTVLRLNPLGGNVLVGSLIGTGSRMVVTDATGVLSSQAIPTLGELSGVPTSRTLTIDGVTYDLSANRTWSVLPTGGTTGQLLAKSSATNYATQWIDNYTSQIKHEVKLAENMSIGTAVYVSGSTGQAGTNMLVSKASNTTEGTSSKTLGLLAFTGVTNDLGFVITEGLLAGLDTSTAGAVGDPVWLGVNGELIFGLANKPYAPAHLVFIGVVTRKQQNNGEIFVKVQNGFELQELHNVQITTTPSDNTVLSYETSTSLYKMKSIATLLGYTPVTNARTITINGTSYDLSADRSWTINSMVYPGAGIAVSTGSAWGTSLTDNSTNWNTAYGWGNHASAGYATTSYVGTQIANLVASSPATLDTLNELAAALGNDAAFSTTVSTALGNRLRVDINTQGLSATLQGYGRTNLGLGTAATANTGDFAAASHTHSIANVTGLQTALDGKQASLGYTPYNSTNPSGYISSYSETDTLATVTARGGSTTAGITVNGRLTAIGGGTYAVTGSSSQRYIMQALNTSNSVNASYGWWWFHNTNGDMGFHADAIGDILTLTRGGGFTINGNTVLNAGNYSSYALPTGGGTMTGQITWSSGVAPISFQQGGNNGTYTQTTIYANQNNTSGDTANGIFIERGYINTSNTEIRHFVIGVRGGGIQWKLDGPGNTTQNGSVSATSAILTSDGASRALYLKGSGNIIQFQDSVAANKWELVGREGTFYIYKNDGGGSGYRWQINSSGNHTINGSINTDSAITAGGKISTSSGGFSLNGNSGFYTSYTGDGLFGATALPNILGTVSNGGSLRLGYQDNGSGLYSPAYGFDVRSTDGIPVGGRVVKAIVMRDLDTGAQPFIVYNNGSIYSATNISVDGEGNFGPDSGSDKGIRIRYANDASGYGRIRFHQAGTNHQTIHSFSAAWQGGTLSGTSSGAINIDGQNGVTFGPWNVVAGYVTSGGTAWFRADVTAFSDARVKENIRPIENALDKILKSRGVIYDRIDNETKDNIGFIAQELEINLPELVMTDLDNLKSVKYQNMTAVLVEAIKEQQTQIESQKTEIEELKDLVKQLINK